jgi:hypothetical protein
MLKKISLFDLPEISQNFKEIFPNTFSRPLALSSLSLSPYNDCKIVFDIDGIGFGVYNFETNKVELTQKFPKAETFGPQLSAFGHPRPCFSPIESIYFTPTKTNHIVAYGNFFFFFLWEMKFFFVFRFL